MEESVTTFPMVTIVHVTPATYQRLGRKISQNKISIIEVPFAKVFMDFFVLFPFVN